MSLSESVHQLNHLLASISKDMLKVQKGNKAAAQRVRVGTIKLEKIAKRFRADSVSAEKKGAFKKKKSKQKKKR